MRILDAGAGTGLLGAALVERGFTSLDALDLSPAMLAEAGRKGIYGSLVEVARAVQAVDVDPPLADR